jgi:Sister chromatid cohesion protein Dcc1
MWKEPPKWLLKLCEGNNNRANNNGITNDNMDDVIDDESFVLLQLPENFNEPSSSSSSVSDVWFRGSRFVGSDGSSQACWITRQDTESYSVRRVETSNTLVLVEPGGSNGCHRLGYFWELEPRQVTDEIIKNRELWNHLPWWDIKNNNNNNNVEENIGKTVEELVVALQLAPAQIRQACQEIGAVEYRGQYGKISESTWHAIRRCILSALVECEEFHGKYTPEGILITNLVEESKLRYSSFADDDDTSDDSVFPQCEAALQHFSQWYLSVTTTTTTTTTTTNSDVVDDYIYLDPRKVNF